MKLIRETFAFDAQSKLDANGFWTAKARFARPGVQVYARDEFADWPDSDKIDGYYAKVLRPESVVFDPEAMKSFENVPISIEHTGDFITPDNTWPIVGAAGSPVTREGDMLTVPVTLYERSAIEGAQDSSRKQLSAGYHLEVKYAPGTDPKYGDYHYIMESWDGNHITLTKAGKAGPDFYVGDKKMTVEKNETVKVEVIRAFDGVQYSFDATTATVFDKILGERDAARAELKKAQDAVLTDEQIDARVTARVEVAKAFPGLDTKGRSMDYLQALLDGAKVLPKPEENEPKTDETKKANDRAFDGPAVDTDAGGLKSARDKFIASGSGRR